MVGALLGILQQTVNWLWSGVVNTVSMPWRGSLAAIIAVYILHSLIRHGGAWLVFGLLLLARGVCRVMKYSLVFIEGMTTNALAKAGIEPTGLQRGFSNMVVILFDGIADRSQSFIGKMQSSRKKRSPLRLRWVMVSAALVPVLFFLTLSSRRPLDVVPPSLSWWHSFEHFLLSGVFPSDQTHERYTLTMKGDCLANINCLLGEALKTTKASAAELRLDNPDKFPSYASTFLLDKLPQSWINSGRRSNLIRELLPEPPPTPVSTPDPMSTLANDTQSPESLTKPIVLSATILIPVRRGALPSSLPRKQVSPTPRVRR